MHGKGTGHQFLIGHVQSSFAVVLFSEYPIARILAIFFKNRAEPPPGFLSLRKMPCDYRSMASARLSTASFTRLAAILAARFSFRWEGVIVIPSAVPAAIPTAVPKRNLPQPQQLLFILLRSFPAKRSIPFRTGLFFPEIGKNPLLNPVCSAIIYY